MEVLDSTDWETSSGEEDGHHEEARVVSKNSIALIEANKESATMRALRRVALRLSLE